MNSDDITAVILERLEAKVDSLISDIKANHKDLELRVRALESARDKIMMLAVLAGFVMPVLITLLLRKVS